MDRLLNQFFGDIFVDDADEELATDLSERWAAFAKTGDPNHEVEQAEVHVADSADSALSQDHMTPQAPRRLFPAQRLQTHARHGVAARRRIGVDAAAPGADPHDFRYI